MFFVSILDEIHEGHGVGAKLRSKGLAMNYNVSWSLPEVRRRAALRFIALQKPRRVSDYLTERPALYTQVNDSALRGMSPLSVQSPFCSPNSGVTAAHPKGILRFCRKWNSFLVEAPS